LSLKDVIDSSRTRLRFRWKTLRGRGIGSTRLLSRTATLTGESPVEGILVG